MHRLPYATIKAHLWAKWQETSAWHRGNERCNLASTYFLTLPDIWLSRNFTSRSRPLYKLLSFKLKTWILEQTDWKKSFVKTVGQATTTVIRYMYCKTEKENYTRFRDNVVLNPTNQKCKVSRGACFHCYQLEARATQGDNLACLVCRPPVLFVLLLPNNYTDILEEL